MILPPATLGMLGGGQLGRMFTVAARTMGYNVIVLDPDPLSPAGAVATEHLRAGFTDPWALDHLATTCAAVTTEFENVPALTLEILAKRCVVRPASRAVAITQDRIHEKTFLRDHKIPTAPFAIVRSEAELHTAIRTVGFPMVLKVARFGYDGKGQVRIRNVREVMAAWNSVKREACVLERQVRLDTEISVVLARSIDDAVASYPVSENAHAEGILDITTVPARISAKRAREAQALARKIAARLEYVGVLAVEFFVSRGKLLVNEIAPRPHNSGHYTIDACATSQFEQQVRTLCGLPLGDTRLLSPVAMVNLLGDLWTGGEPRWERVLTEPRAKLHLYGKRDSRPGRKMGHFTVVAPSAAAARRQALAMRKGLTRPARKKR